MCNNETDAYNEYDAESCDGVRARWHHGWTGCLDCGYFEERLFTSRDTCYGLYDTSLACNDAIVEEGLSLEVVDYDPQGDSTPKVVFAVPLHVCWLHDVIQWCLCENRT